MKSSFRNVTFKQIGALTAKEYPFIFRNWELKTFTGFHYSGSYADWVYISIKNDKIMRIFPVPYHTTNSSFISDKVRFSFDGVYSYKTLTKTHWNEFFENIFYFFYFFDHLNTHFLRFKTFVVSFTQNISIEILNLLVLFSKKYNFIKLRKLDNVKINNDLETNFLINSMSNSSSDILRLSDLCFLLNINTRYEEPNLNFKIRQRIKKGEFKVLSLNSLTNLTFPQEHLGTNMKTLLDIVEGVHWNVQELKYSTNPLVIYNAELHNRFDSKIIQKLLIKLENMVSVTTKNWTTINVLNSTLTANNLPDLVNLKPISETDLKKFEGFYFINPIETSTKFANLIELKLLNYISTTSSFSKIFIEQSHNDLSKINKKLQKVYNVNAYINLPNTNFFENIGTFLNAEGIYRKTVKLGKFNKNTKDDWQILRKFFSYIESINFTSNSKMNTKLMYNSRNLYNFKNYINFQFYACMKLSYKSYFLTKQKSYKILEHSKFQESSQKFYNTVFRFWLNDFYMDGRCFYSDNSLLMNKCSRYFRAHTTNF